MFPPPLKSNVQQRLRGDLAAKVVVGGGTSLQYVLNTDKLIKLPIVALTHH